MFAAILHNIKILSELYLNNNNQILFFRILSKKIQRLLKMKARKK